MELMARRQVVSIIGIRRYIKISSKRTIKKHNKRGYLDVVRASRFTLRILGLDVLAVELCLMIYECVARLRINLPGGKCS